MTDDQIHLETTSIVSVITISHRALFNNSPVSPLHLRQAPGRRGPLIAAPDARGRPSAAPAPATAAAQQCWLLHSPGQSQA